VSWPEAADAFRLAFEQELAEKAWLV